jgi:hypothetical protein
MKITLDEATLSKAVISYLQGVGVQSDILEVQFRYTRVPYTVFAEVELAETQVTKPAKTRIVEASPAIIAAEVNSLCDSIVDPDNLPPLEEPVTEEPRPDMPAAPLFGGG